MQVLTPSLSKNIKIYGMQEDMEFDRTLKAIRKEVSHETGVILFSPDSYDGKNYDFDL